MKNYDIVIIGSGPGGYVSAIKARHLGASVALIEKQDIGGVCLNIGCIPTKALIKSAKVYKTIQSSENYGIKVDKEYIKLDWNNILKRKENIVNQLSKGVKMLLDKNGVDIYTGLGKVVNPNLVEVNNEKLNTKNIILATGASALIPPIPGIKEAYEKKIVVTSKEILSLPSIPKDLVIIGGGVIGIEFATIFSSFNSNVTIIEKQENILLNIDDEIRSTYLKFLKKAKINIITNASVTKVNNNQVTYHFNGKDININADKILISVGMKPNINGLEHLNLEMNKNAIKVNEHMETSVKGVYAIGDVNGNLMLAHVASAEGIIAVENIMGKNTKLDYDKIPSGIYGIPEIAMVGKTEQELKANNIEYKVSKFPFIANGKALAEGEHEGFIKIISDKKYGELLGMHILGSSATDLISEAVTTMELEGTVYELAKAVHPHPTLSEIIMEAAHGSINKAIHIY